MVIYYYYSWRWNNTYYPPCAMTNQPLRPKTPGSGAQQGGRGKERSRCAYTWKIRRQVVVRFKRENFMRLGIAEWGPASQKLNWCWVPPPPFPTRKRRHGSLGNPTPKKRKYGYSWVLSWFHFFLECTASLALILFLFTFYFLFYFFVDFRFFLEF